MPANPVVPDTPIIVAAERDARSAVGAVAPIATLDAAAIRALALTSVADLIKRTKALASGADGSDPVYLLNGHRIAETGAFYSLPDQAVDRVEILPETEAARYGFPPTRRLMNIILKKRFRALSATELAGTTTEGAGGTSYTAATATRIANQRIVSLSATHFHQAPVRQNQRGIDAGAASPFAIAGNVGGVDGGSIAPGLDALAGRPVPLAAVPAQAEARRTLAAYATSGVAVTDPGPYRTLQARTDKTELDASLASPLSRTVDGSLGLGLTRERVAGLNGLAPLALRVPADNPALPFGTDVMLYRAIPGVLLRQRSDRLALRGSAMLEGAVAAWTWSVTTAYDQVRATARSDEGVPLDAVQTAVAAGGDPFAPLPPAVTAQRLVERDSTRTRTLTSKAVIGGSPFHLPAGAAQLTASADIDRSTSSVARGGGGGVGAALARTIAGTSLSLTLPLTARRTHILAPLGDMEAHGTIGVADVSRYGRLWSGSAGLTWTPRPRIQLSASMTEARTPPPIASLVSPTLSSPNTPVFDFTTGTSALVTIQSGGNPALRPERRRTTTLGVAIQPWAKREMRFNLAYVDTRVRDQAATLNSPTAAIQSAFPALFARTAGGMLTGVDLRPVNLASERERKLRLSTDISTALGKAPPAPSDKTTAAPAKPRPFLFATLAATVRLDDRLTLAPGAPALDLLDGATVTGTGGKARWDMETNMALSYGAFSTNLFGDLQGPTRVRSPIAAADLHFSARTFLVAWERVDLSKLVERSIARNASIDLTVENLLNNRIRVRDRDGATPYRFQPAFLDPIGRSIRVGLRKLF